MNVKQNNFISTKNINVKFTCYLGSGRDRDSIGSCGERGARAQGPSRCGWWCAAADSADGRETDYSGHGSD